MDDILLELLTQTPVAAILLAWVYAERNQHRETRQFYRQMLADCHAHIATALAQHIEAESK